jgi:hypothetical protein
MNMANCITRLIAAVCLMLVAAREMRADGGVVRLQTGEGPLVAVLFAPADLSRDLATELNVLVQDRLSGEVVLNAEVELRFTPPPGARLPLNDPWCRPVRSTFLAGADGGMEKLPLLRLTRAQSDNHLLYGASAVFPVAGDWRVQLIVRRASEVIVEDGTLGIGTRSNRLATVWPWLALPPCLIVLFVLNQRLRSRRHLTV